MRKIAACPVVVPESETSACKNRSACLVFGWLDAQSHDRTSDFR